EFGVSRAVFREAVRLLEHHGVASMRRGPHGGLVVREPNLEAVTRAITVYLDYRGGTVPQLMTMRTAIELACGEEAGECIDAGGAAQLRDALADELDSYANEARLDHGVHKAIAQAAQNTVLELFLDVLTRLTGKRSGPELRQPSDHPTVIDDVHKAHTRIV